MAINAESSVAIDILHVAAVFLLRLGDTGEPFITGSVICVSCGFAACADVNAARTILAKGLTTLGRTGGHLGMACESSPVAGRKQELRPARVDSLPLHGQV